MSVFHEPGYLIHNKARLDHLASLNLSLQNRSVLELGAGVGDHTPFFLDRGCTVTITDGRPENVEVIRDIYPECYVSVLDVEKLECQSLLRHEVVYCYGLLYHCYDPFDVITRIVRHITPKMLLIETCVSQFESSFKKENKNDLRDSIHGVGSRPNRAGLRAHLKKYFRFVYMPLTQPDHEEFPLDWTQPITTEARAIYIATTFEIKNNPLLTVELPMKQTRYENTAR